MRPLVQAIKGGIGGYVLGVIVAWALGGGGTSPGVRVTAGAVFALIGWLAGIGGWKQWGREWFGRPVETSQTSGWTRYFQFNTDHKVVGIQYLVTFIAVLGLGGVMAMLMRIELARAGTDFMAPDTFNKVMSMHGILMVAVAVAGILGAFGNYLVPLMIGADDMAFPRLNALSFWLIPPVAVTLLTAPLLGSFEAGWTVYPPLSVLAPGDGQLLFNIGVITFGLSSIFGGLNILTTVATMRAPGMTWGRLPIFVWGAVAASLISVSFTQFFAASLVLIHLDRIAGTTFFGAASGGDALLYQHMFWFYSHPAVYIMVLPAFGVSLEIITHFSRKPLFAYKAVVAAFLGIVGLSGIVWAHHMFTSGMANYLHAPFMALTEAISVPTGVVFLAAIGTMWRGRLWFTTPMLLATGWVFNFMIGGLTGIFHADVATDVQLQDTYFVVAHFHFTIIGGSIFGLLAGSFYWFPKITGRMYNERLGKIFAFWVTLGLNLTFLPMFWVGLHGMNRRIGIYSPELETVNRFISFAAFFLATGFLLFVFNLVWSAIKGPKAPDNPWGASTLEWSVSSPPPHHNFPLLPEIVGHPYVYGKPGAEHATFATTGGE
jgi:cytochrome c oxidase subunit I